MCCILVFLYKPPLPVFSRERCILLNDLYFISVRGETIGYAGYVAGDGFAIAGKDRKFVRADAVIDGETILVNSPQVARPVAVRYAWARNPVCNVVNKAGLPASPFRTDAWPGVTAGKK